MPATHDEATAPAPRIPAAPGDAAEQSFYRDVVDPEKLDRALAIDGIDGEIGVLRVRLHRLLKEHEDEVPLLLRGVELLVRAVAARYRMSPKSRDALADSMTDTLQKLGQQIFPERFDDV